HKSRAGRKAAKTQTELALITDHGSRPGGLIRRTEGNRASRTALLRMTPGLHAGSPGGLRSGGDRRLRHAPCGTQRPIRRTPVRLMKKPFPDRITVHLKPDF